MPSQRQDDWLAKLRPRRRPLYSAWSRRLKGWRYGGAIALLAIGYQLLTLLIFQFPLPASLTTYPIWPPAAYSELILLMLGLRFWPAIALGTFLNHYFSQDLIVFSSVSTLLAFNNTLQGVLGAWLLLRANFSPKFDQMRDVNLMLVFGGLMPSLISATIGVLVCCLARITSFSDFGDAWFNWWIGNFTGVLMLFPAILTLPYWRQRFASFQDQATGLLWAGTLSLLSWFIFASAARSPLTLFPYLAFPLITWGALRFGPPGAAISILITTGFAGLGFIEGRGPFFVVLEEPEQAILALQIYISVLVITTLALSAGAAERESAQAELMAEKEKSEQLLLNILPQPIATRLKESNGTIADQFAEVTVLFADIVDFTRMSSELTPQALVIMLNDIFSMFDALADKHGLEKIKTIGDAYMVVGGLPEHRDDHAIAIAEMALDMHTAIVTFSQEHPHPFTMRMGINTGPVVAGVIGKKKFIYDLWGDTVNIASRMESTGIAGEIQVTESTYQALHKRYQFECRGEISVKGKGTMKTYLLRDRQP